MTHELCAVGHNIPGRHADGCTEPTCRGCAPAIATPGLRVCGRHETRTHEGLRDLPGLWADLGDTRKGLRSGGRPGGDGAPLPLDDNRVDSRRAIRTRLVSWCLVLADDYQLTMPADTIRAMAHHVAVQTGRLLASDHADLLAREITDTAAEAWRLARPTSARTWRILCDCGERVPVEPDNDIVMACRACGTWGVLSWWIEHSAPASDLVTATQAVGVMWDTYRVRVTLDQIAHWSSRGHLAAVDTAEPDGPGRPANRYRMRAILRLALDARDRRTA